MGAEKTRYGKLSKDTWLVLIGYLPVSKLPDVSLINVYFGVMVRYLAKQRFQNAQPTLFHAIQIQLTLVPQTTHILSATEIIHAGQLGWHASHYSAPWYTVDRDKDINIYAYGTGQQLACCRGFQGDFDYPNTVIHLKGENVQDIIASGDGEGNIHLWRFDQSGETLENTNTNTKKRQRLFKRIRENWRAKADGNNNNAKHGQAELIPHHCVPTLTPYKTFSAHENAITAMCAVGDQFVSVDDEGVMKAWSTEQDDSLKTYSTKTWDTNTDDHPIIYAINASRLDEVTFLRYAPGTEDTQEKIEVIHCDSEQANCLFKADEMVQDKAKSPGYTANFSCYLGTRFALFAYNGQLTKYEQSYDDRVYCIEQSSLQDVKVNSTHLNKPKNRGLRFFTRAGLIAEIKRDNTKGRDRKSGRCYAITIADQGQINSLRDTPVRLCE